MISPAEIRVKATRLYPRIIAAHLNGTTDELFPYRIPANLKLPSDHAEAIREVNLLRESSKPVTGYGYDIHWERRSTRKHGDNEFPEAIVFTTSADAIRTAGKTNEFQSLCYAVTQLRTAQPRLDSWLCQSTHWKQLLSVQSELSDLLLVVEYFLANPRPDCFTREVPLPISTKLIEQNRKFLSQWLDLLLPPETIDVRYSPSDAFDARYGLRYSRPHFLCRILDQQLRIELGIQFDEFSLPADSLARLAVNDATVYLIENKVNLLTYPKQPRSLALGGLGNGVTQLCSIGWLADSKIHYWGDLDFEGFEILSRVRRQFPQVVSIHMDHRTLAAHRDHAINGNWISRNIPENLTPEEQQVCEILREENLRLEQERIPQSWLAH